MPVLMVSLKQYNDGTFAYVDETKCGNDVDPKPNRPTCIYWMLDETLLDAGGKFVPISPAGASGFRWDAPAPANFEEPVLVEDGTIMIKDHHRPGDPEVSLPYTLTIELNKVLYQTVRRQHNEKSCDRLGTKSGNSPLIHNK
jgi:hypothetical protein